jgi:hypothetical protein
MHSFRARLMTGLTTVALAAGIAAGPASADTTGAVPPPPQIGQIQLATNPCVATPSVPNCENYAVALARYVVSLADPNALITLVDGIADNAVVTAQGQVTGARQRADALIDQACQIAFGPGGCGSLPLPQ